MTVLLKIFQTHAVRSGYKKKEKKDEKAIANQVYVPPQYQKAV